MKRFKLLALIFQCCLLGHSQSKLTNIKAITNEGAFSTPIWSPDGEKILFTDHHNDALFVIDLKQNLEINKVKSAQGIGYLASWTSDSKKIIYREKPENGTFSDLRVKTLNLETGEENSFLRLHPDDMRSLRVPKKEAIIVYINQETLKLEAKNGVNGTPWVITTEEGSYYHPILSPDEKFVVVHKGPNIYLYSVQGRALVKDLGFGLASGWLPDNSGIVTFEDKSEDGHNVTASELFFIGTKTSKKIQLTASDSIIEMWGDVSPDGKKIAFSDERSGKIFIADFNLKN